MNIVQIVTRGDDIGGAQVHVRDLSEALMERGHAVTVLAGGGGAFSRDLDKRGVPNRSIRHLAAPIHPVRDALALMELVNALRRIRPDVVATHTAKAGFLGRLAAAALGQPAVYTPHGWSISDRVSARKGQLFRGIERSVASITSRIVNVCDYERELAMACGIGDAPKLAVVHNGIRDAGVSLRADVTQGPPRLIMVARMAEPKDHGTLLQALAQLKALRWELELVGDGPLEAQLKRRAGQLGIADRVRFTGFRSDAAERLSQAQIFVLSSRSEAFPYSILEAMRAGLPVVASRAGGIAEAVAEGRTGCLVPPGDARALAEALARLMVQPALRKEFGDAGRRRFLANFTFETMVDRTVDLYREAANLGRVPADIELAAPVP